MWYNFLIDACVFFWLLFVDWIRTIFVVPFRNVDMLWLLVPVWLAWFFAEFFQEKTGTSMGNAISNAVVILWGSIDCARQTTQFLTKNPALVMEAILRYLLVFIIFAYGAIIVYLGIKGNKLIKYVGRIREITYVFVMFVPIFYGAISFSWNHILATIIFFPLFYFVIEVIDRYTPDPKAVMMDLAGEPKHELPAGRLPPMHQPSFVKNHPNQLHNHQHPNPQHVQQHPNQYQQRR